MNNALIPEEITMSFDTSQDINMNIDNNGDISLSMDGSSIGGEYPPLINKPKINDVTLLGNKTSEELHLQHKMNEITPQEIDKIIYG